MCVLDSLTAILFVWDLLSNMSRGFDSLERTYGQLPYLPGHHSLTPGPLTPYVLHIPPHNLSCILYQVFTPPPPPPPPPPHPPPPPPHLILDRYPTIHTVPFPFLLSYTQRILSYQVSGSVNPPCLSFTHRYPTGLVTHPIRPTHTDILLV